jgi:DNA sulfur modification protein DndB
MAGAVYTFPAIKGKMGSTVFYQALMRADELAATVHAAMDFEEFQGSLAHEQMQRKLNEARVEKEIVPYLTNHPDRFFGSLIVLAYKPRMFEFKSLADLGFSEPQQAAYRKPASPLGLLVISGGKLFALDGQHRLHALRTVTDPHTTTTKHLRIPIRGPFRHEVAKDQLSVIFVEFETKQKARRIFNKVNRYAKPTSASTNILTSEDDGYAIISRVLMGFDDPDTFLSDIPSPLAWIVDGRPPAVEMEKDTLSGANPAFSTVRAIYNMAREICTASGLKTLEEGKVVIRPSNEELRAAYEKCAEWWDALTENFEPYGVDADDIPSFADRRKAENVWSLAYRPVSQEALVQGLMMAHVASGLGAEVLTRRLNEMPLRLGRHPWVNILAGTNGKMIIKNRALAVLLVAWYLVGAEIGAHKVAELEKGFAAIHGASRRLPQPID